MKTLLNNNSQQEVIKRIKTLKRPKSCFHCGH